jgi:hypothetical protein
MVWNGLMYLNNGLASNKMGTAANCDATTVLVFNLSAAFDHLAEVVEATRAVCICEDDVLPSDMPHAMRDSAAFSAILLQCDHADATMGYMCRMRCRCVAVLRPRSRLRYRMLAELVFLCEFQSFVDCSVLAAIADNQDLPALIFPTSMRCAILFL